MPEITTVEEMLSCNEAVRRVLSLPLWADDDEETQAALRQMWMAGRDWARVQERRRLQECHHVTPCPSAETCFLKTED